MFENVVTRCCFKGKHHKCKGVATIGFLASVKCACDCHTGSPYIHKCIGRKICVICGKYLIKETKMIKWICIGGGIVVVLAVIGFFIKDFM
jgi:hypothetical protein